MKDIYEGIDDNYKGLEWHQILGKLVDMYDAAVLTTRALGMYFKMEESEKKYGKRCFICENPAHNIRFSTYTEVPYQFVNREGKIFASKISSDERFEGSNIKPKKGDIQKSVEKNVDVSSESDIPKNQENSIEEPECMNIQGNEIETMIQSKSEIPSKSIPKKKCVLSNQEQIELANQKREKNQSSSLCNADRENILHWKLANDYFQSYLKVLKPESKESEIVIKEEKSIKDLYEEIRFNIRELYTENKNAHGRLNEDQMDYYEILVESLDENINISSDHVARQEKLNNEICTAWFNHKTKIDWTMKKYLKEEFKFASVCLCTLKDLSADKIYGSWNGCVWRCQDEKKPPGY